MRMQEHQLLSLLAPRHFPPTTYVLSTSKTAWCYWPSLSGVMLMLMGCTTHERRVSLKIHTHGKPKHQHHHLRISFCTKPQTLPPPKLRPASSDHPRPLARLPKALTGVRATGAFLCGSLSAQSRHAVLDEIKFRRINVSFARCFSEPALSSLSRAHSPPLQ